MVTISLVVKVLRSQDTVSSVSLDIRLDLVANNEAFPYTPYRRETMREPYIAAFCKSRSQGQKEMNQTQSKAFQGKGAC